MASSSTSAGSVQVTFTRVLVADCASLVQDREARAARDRATRHDRPAPPRRLRQRPAAALRVLRRPNSCAVRAYQPCRYISASEAEVPGSFSPAGTRLLPAAASESRSFQHRAHRLADAHQPPLPLQPTHELPQRPIRHLSSTPRMPARIRPQQAQRRQGSGRGGPQVRQAGYIQLLTSLMRISNLRI
jgi:hypothetical protein